MVFFNFALPYIRRGDRSLSSVIIAPRWWIHTPSLFVSSIRIFLFLSFFFHRALNCSRRKKFKKKKRVTFVAKLYFCKNFELFADKQKLYKLIISLSLSKDISYVFLFDQLEEVEIRKIFGVIIRLFEKILMKNY